MEILSRSFREILVSEKAGSTVVDRPFLVEAPGLGVVASP